MKLDKPKRKKKSSRKLLVEKLDKIFSLYIRKKNNSTCFTCGSQNNATCGHLLSRSSYSTRWIIENAECQCVGCNMTHEYKPEIFTEKYIEKYGFIQYQELCKVNKIIVKLSNSDLEIKLNYYQKLFDDLE